MAISNGAPDRIRTCGFLIRSQTLYPAELRAPVVIINCGQILVNAKPTSHQRFPAVDRGLRRDPLAFSAKLFATFRACDLDVSFAFWHTEPLLAGGAFKISMGFPFLKDSLLDAEPGSKDSCFLQKHLVFSPAFCKVAG